jgi:transposase
VIDLKQKPRARAPDVHAELERVWNRRVSQSVCNRTLQQMGWSWKVPTKFQIAKYQPKILLRYVDFIEWIQSVEDWTHLKFCDESHIIPRKIGSVLGLVNQRVYLRESTLNQASASLTILTTLTPLESGLPLFIDYREESNTQWDFLEFVISACESKALKRGDYLICINAAVHGGAESLDMLLGVLEACGITLVFLPPYSPELNPCELVFGMMKGYLRRCSDAEAPSAIFDRVLLALDRVTPRHLLSFYKHCIYPKVILPDLNL